MGKINGIFFSHIGLRDRIFLQDDIEEGDSRVISEQLQIDHAVISMMR